MEATLEKPILEKKKKKFLSLPLLKQSIKANWLIWFVLTLTGGLLFVIINSVLGGKTLFASINMDAVNRYINDEGMDWLKVLGLLDTMGFSLSRIQVMSQIDLNSILCDLAYKIAGVLLPMIYVMITANKLVAAQVNDGSMAYILSTPTNRKRVLRTQYVFLIASIFLMYVFIFAVSSLSELIAYSANGKFTDYLNNYNFVKTSIYCVGSFFSMVAIGGICFGASTFFNKSKYSIAIGGGVCVLSFLSCILGLFGSPVFVAVGLGVPAMNFFNYLSIFTLIDTNSISEFTKSLYGMGVLNFNWLINFGILAAIGIVFAFVGSIVFVKKDLPL